MHNKLQLQLTDEQQRVIRSWIWTTTADIVYNPHTQKLKDKHKLAGKVEAWGQVLGEQLVVEIKDKHKRES